MTLRRSGIHKRARWTRSDGDILLGGPVPSGQAASTIWWMGDDRVITTPGSGDGLAAVTRATSLIADSLAALPWRRLSGSGDQGTATIEMPTPRWVADPMLLRPDNRISGSATPAALRLGRSSFWGQLIRAALMHGNGFLLFQESGSGEPVPGTMRILNPDSVLPVEQPYIHRRIGSGGEYVESDYDGRFEVGGSVYRLMELRNPASPVDGYGQALGVVEKHALELGMARQAVNYGSGMFRSGVPAGFLKTSQPNFTKDQADALKARWLEAHGGDRRSIAVLNATTDFEPLSMSPVDMALVQSRQMSLTDIANAFGVPVYMLGGTDGGSNTYSNAESRNQDFVRFSLLPWATAVEDLLSSLPPLGEHVEVGFGGLLRADTTTRYGAYSQALSDGWITVDEVRLLEGLQPLPDSTQPQIVAGQEGTP